MTITFTNPRAFTSNKGTYVPFRTTLKAEVPPQETESEFSKFIGASKGSIRSSVVVFSSSSFVLNLLFSMSLDLLWSMINALQIIVFLPLFNVSFTAIVTTLSNALIVITNFTVIPYEFLNDFFFDF